MRRALRLAGRASPSIGTAIVSQMLGAAQLLFLIRAAGASEPVDAFLVGFAIIQAPASMFVIGVLYPLRLADQRGGTWDRDHLRAGVAGALAGAIGLAVISAEQGTHIALALGPPLILAGVFASAASVSAVGLACTGRGEAIVGLAVLPNLAALACLVASQNSAALTATSRMAVGLAVGNAGTLLLYRYLWVHVSGNRNLPTERVQLHGAVRWLVVGSVVGHGGQLLLQAAAGALDEGDATAWGVVARVASFVTFVGVTAVLPMFLSWNKSPGPKLQGHLRTVYVVGSLAALLLLAVEGLARPVGDVGRVASLAPLLVCWIVAAGANSVLGSSAQRLGRFRAYRSSTFATAPVLVVGAAALLWTKDLGTGAATIAIASCVSGLCMAEALEWPRLKRWIGLLVVVTVLGTLV